MATSGDGSGAYEIAGAGGKFRKRPLRRSIPATPYDRPHIVLKNSNSSMLKKLVDPASRLVYAGAHRLFDVFRKSLPPPSLLRPLGINEMDAPQEERQSDSSANITTTTGISELEHMLQEKTFTRSEIQRLTSLLHSRTTESPSGVSDSLEKHGDVRDNFHAGISTPIGTSKVLEEIASPAELAKSYMGSRPTTQALRQVSKSIQRTPITSVTQKAANSLRDLENGFVTPRSRGRSTMYTMARTPYTRSPTFSQKGIRSGYGHGAASTSSLSVLGHEGKMVSKHSSSVLDDDIGSGGPLRRIRQKANVSSQRNKKELGHAVFQQDGSSQNPLLPNVTKPKVSGYAFVPAKSTQTANKILQHLEKPSPKEKNEKYSVPSHAGTREKSPNKLTSEMLHGQALRSLEKVDAPKFLLSCRDIQKPETQHHARFHQPISQIKDKTEENGSRKFVVPNNMLTSVNGDSTNSSKDKAPIVGVTDLPSKAQVEPPQKKCAYQMGASVHSVEIDNDIHDNGHVSFPLVTNDKPETSVVDIIKNPAALEISKSHTLVETSNPVLSEVAEVPEPAEAKDAENATSVPNTDVDFVGGSVREQGLGFKIPNSSPSTATTHSSMLQQSTLQIERIAPEKDSSSFSIVKTVENVLPVPFSANKSSPNSSPDPKTNYSISVNGDCNDQKSTNTSGSFLFGTANKNLSTPNMTPASNPNTFSSFAAFPAPASTTISTATASTTISTTNSTAAAIFSTSVTPPVFSFGSAVSTAPATSTVETGNISTRSSFATATTTTTTGSGLFGISSPAATLTTTSQSQGSVFNITNGSQTRMQASSVPVFGSSAPTFGSSPSFGIGSLGPSLETKSGNFASGTTNSIFGSTWQQPQKSSGLSSTFSSSPSSPVFAFGASSTHTPSSVTGGATHPSFAGPPVFGNSTPVFGAATTSPNNNSSNDQLSMEDNMAEDSMQITNPVSAPGFMFGSATPIPNPSPSPSPAVVPFQFGGQSNQAPPPQNPFQSSSLEFKAGGGSFSLGSGGEKSNRRVVRVVKSKNRRK